MDHQEIARYGLAALCALQGAATVVIDSGRTHARHPDWLGHARFHVVWQTASVALLSLLEIALVLIPGALEDQRFYLAAILAAFPMAGFFVALLARASYGGTLADPKGMPPLMLNLRGSSIRIDLNLVAEIVGVLTLLACLVIYRGRWML